MRSVYHQHTHTAGRVIAETILGAFTTCPILKIARLGRTLRQWRQAFPGHVDTSGPSNGGAETIDSLIELHRRVARGFRNHNTYRLRAVRRNIPTRRAQRWHGELTAR